MLISATGSQLPIHKAPAVASIITAEDIEKIGATDLNQVLETVPGVHVILNPLLSVGRFWSFRGIHASTGMKGVLLLMNGVPINSIYTGNIPQYCIIPVADISRVEVIRGPGSAVHGADAFGGTINIITKDAHEINGYRAGLRGGSFNTYDAWAQYGGSLLGWNVALSMEYQRSDGDDGRIIEADNQSRFDGRFGSDASLTPAEMLTNYEVFNGHIDLNKDYWDLRLWTWFLKDGGSGADPSQSVTQVEDAVNYDQYLAEIEYTNPELFTNWEMRFYSSFLYRSLLNKWVMFPPGAVLPIGDDGNAFTGNNLVTFTDGYIGQPGYDDKEAAIEGSAFYTGFNNHRIRSGAGFKFFDLTATEKKNFGPSVINGTQPVVDGTLTDLTGSPYAYIPDKERKLWYLFLQDEWHFAKKWELTAGVRYDHFSDFGDTINPRLALVWETRYDFTTKLLYGRAFRAPSFQELYVQNNPLFLGNDELNPQTIDTVELAFDYQLKSNLRTILNMFAYETKEIIAVLPDKDADGNPMGTRTFHNAGTEIGYGFEIEVDWEVTDTIHLNGNFAFQHSEDKDTGEETPDAPGIQLYLNPHWKFYPNWSLDAQIYWIGDRVRAESDTREEIDDYALVNMTLRRKNIFKHWDIALAVRNLFDEDAREPAANIPDDYPMEGLSFYGEVRFHYE